ncbi:MAG: biotin carboxyl carrier domain-containing protein [Elusimicrobia bacterium]|nr:biotin carboxyl carrier domain-containing protein [Elusimicrobiota bacterium]
MAKTAIKKKAAAKKPAPAENNPPALAELKKLYDFMQGNQLETVEFRQGETHLRLARRKPAQVAVPVPMVSAMAAPQPGQQQPQAPQAYQGQSIKSPLMGIFYRASTPSSPPFVREGETVKTGHVLGLVEAMKVFNEVKAEFDCTITKVLVDNGKPVKSGEVLFAIERK